MIIPTIMEEGPQSQKGKKKEKGRSGNNHKESDSTSKELQNKNSSEFLATKIKSPKAKEKEKNESNHKESEIQNENPSEFLATKVKSSPKAKEKGKNESNHKENDGTSKKLQNKNPTKVKSLKAKKKDKAKYKYSGVGSPIFAQDEITNNKEASALISDLVKCYTCNSNLPQTELDILNKTLYEKTVTLFLHILNNCVEKIFNKVLGTDIFKEIFLSKKVVKKDVVCQTDISYSHY